MSDDHSAHSIQTWLESCAQGYLSDTVFGRAPGGAEPALILENEVLREETIWATVQLVVGERCALAASSGLINAAPDEASRRFLATQTLDEARHVEIFTRRLQDLGVPHDEVEDTLRQQAHPQLVELTGILLDKVDRKDFVAGMVGQNIVLEGMSFTVFEVMHAMHHDIDPRFSCMLAGAIADERRHVGFGESRVRALIRERPGKRLELERMQREMCACMIAAVADGFRASRAAAELRALGCARPHAVYRGLDLDVLAPEATGLLLAETVLAELRTRLGRVGIQYRAPERAVA